MHFTEKLHLESHKRAHRRANARRSLTTSTAGTTTSSSSSTSSVANAKPFPCSTCGKSYTTRSNLWEHEQSHQGGIKLFCCPICSKGFTRRRHVELHLLIHSGTYLYSCAACGRNFRQKGNMVRHRCANAQFQLPHGESGGKTSKQTTVGLRQHRGKDYGKQSNETMVDQQQGTVTMEGYSDGGTISLASLQNDDDDEKDDMQEQQGDQGLLEAVGGRLGAAIKVEYSDAGTISLAPLAQKKKKKELWEQDTEVEKRQGKMMSLEELLQPINPDDDVEEVYQGAEEDQFSLKLEDDEVKPMSTGEACKRAPWEEEFRASVKRLALEVLLSSGKRRRRVTPNSSSPSSSSARVSVAPVASLLLQPAAQGRDCRQ